MAAFPRYVSVAVPTPLRRTFQYRLEDGRQAPPGARVTVPFGNRKLVGMVLEHSDTTDIDPARIRPVVEVLDDDACLTVPLQRLCTWAANYYNHPVGDVITHALPVLIRKGGNPRAPIEYLQLTAPGHDVDPDTLKQSPAQRNLLGLLRPGKQSREILRDADIATRTIRAIVDKGWAEWTEEKEETLPPFTLSGVNTAGIELTDEQSRAIESVAAEGTYLLQGVTGSGKTEVYFRIIEPLLVAGKQVLVLVPEIGLTPQTISRFRERFETPVIVLHSSLTDRERSLGWMQAREGSVGIVLGTRSAIFTPLANPGAIIVDEEHDSSYKQQDGFRYSARDLAVLRGQFENMPVILGSATPSLESLHNVETGKYQLLELRHRPPGAVTENYELIDTRHLEITDGFTRALKARIGEQLRAGNQVLVFLNRRGFAPVLMCSACQWIAQCRRCDARLTYHLNLNTLVCHHCGTMHHNILSCQSCGSQHVSAIGLGTQRVEQTLSGMFPDTPVLRIDRDSTRRQGAMEEFVEEINRGDPAILVGTQLLAKGHHFPNVTLVALLDIDASFFSSDFRALERMGQLLLQVGGRAGRADKAGSVIVQSEFAAHELFETLVKQGYSEFAASLLAERRTHELPPYHFHVLIRAEASDPSLAKDFLEAVTKSSKVDPTVNLLGPVPALMEKKAGRFRQILILASGNRPALHRELDKRVSFAEQSPLARKVRWAVDVDPVDLF